MWYWDDEISLELSPGVHNISRPPGGLPNLCPGSRFAWIKVVSLFLKFGKLFLVCSNKFVSHKKVTDGLVTGSVFVSFLI